MSGKMSSLSNTVVVVKIISDIVWPWCFVGKRNLEKAIASSGISCRVEWLPFFLAPDTPPEGENLRDHLAAKYGEAMARKFTSPG